MEKRRVNQIAKLGKARLRSLPQDSTCEKGLCQLTHITKKGEAPYHGSSKNTCVAATRCRPTPPALRDSKKMVVLGSCVKLSTAAERSSMLTGEIGI